ncbi:hypothetical protein FDP41_006232 [Naegleria fowleri]|uniref:Pentacotripeptide-repeat region of PRORP domain-containing protein n=1 Tax=Naegleria fowleri TaxID=5763 RepID=A0A6A5BKR0_NAEFO|nr:uncharacterized protein FDP41_006232 [Naegleria fowleri]KAF0974758.1 hypothetical protein FDP41_006232 [Naegleria fowleri]CAG4719031.1 unnamed protein product [Naegleria fowleri]
MHRSRSAVSLACKSSSLSSLLSKWIQADLKRGSEIGCSHELHGIHIVHSLGIICNHHRNYGSVAAPKLSEDVKLGTFMPETYTKFESMLSSYQTKLKEELPLEQYVETSTWLSDFLKKSKDDEEYDVKFVEILRKIMLLKERNDYFAIDKVFHTQFLPIFNENKRKILEKMKYERENRMKDMGELPRIHYVIFNEYLNALAKSHQKRKIMVTLQRMEKIHPFLPTAMHVTTALHGLIDDPSKTIEAKMLLERYRNRFSHETRRYVQACLYVLNGLDQSGSFNEAIEFIEQNNIIELVEKTHNGVLLAKILRIATNQKNLPMVESLIKKFLSKIDDPDFPYFSKTKDKLITALIGYYTVIGNEEQVQRCMSKLRNLDSKFYLAVLKQLYLNGKPYETLLEFVKQIPSHLRNDYHFGYLIRVCADQNEFEKARELFRKAPRSETSFNLYSQMLRALYLENKGKESAMEAISIYEEMLSQQQAKKTSRSLHNGEASLFMMKILEQAGFYSQLESFFDSLHTPGVPHWLFMARYYVKQGNLEKLQQAKAAIKTIRPLPEHYIAN